MTACKRKDDNPREALSISSTDKLSTWISDERAEPLFRVLRLEVPPPMFLKLIHSNKIRGGGYSGVIKTFSHHKKFICTLLKRATKSLLK